MLIGMDERQYSKELALYAFKYLGSKNVRIIGPRPYSEVSEYLAATDLVVVPQRRNIATIGQASAKIFDAMEMTIPIAATDVNDLLEILDGC